ncbi:putative membrane protein [Candidatus Desulfosporosinus infrequens]|uniref:Putative membrane protein n=1 Tax=Candidatus Desulfosporosinus infrequens TaxID=2043169 RepID=A0A2U3JVU9_9FIRM|nr:putative membrane protein [Candidatus Desulfosporosinus infrequens]
MSKQSTEFMRFCLVGAVNTGIDLAVFAILSSGGFSLLVAHSLSYTCGVLNSFLLNRTWTFRGHGQSHGQLIRFLALNLVTLTLTYGLLVYFNTSLAWPLLVCKLLATGVSLGINYFGSRLWIFSPISESNGVI